MALTLLCGVGVYSFMWCNGSAPFDDNDFGLGGGGGIAVSIVIVSLTTGR